MATRSSLTLTHSSACAATPRIVSVASPTACSCLAGSLIAAATYYRAPEATLATAAKRDTPAICASLESSGGLLGLARLQLALEHLAGRVARELVEELDLARDLVAGEVVLDVSLDVVLVEILAPL